MNWPPISKSLANLPVQPNLVDYDKARADFSWEAIRKELCGLPNGGLNIAHEAVDHHAAGPRRDHLALRWLSADGATRDFNYRHLAEGSSRFANMLRELGTGKGDRVFALAGRIPELYISALGTLKNTSVFCPLFSAFGPEPIFQRLHRGDAKVLVTTAQLYKRRSPGYANGCRSCSAYFWLMRMTTCPQRCCRCRNGWQRRRASSRSRQPIPRRWRYCISPAALRACRRARSTHGAVLTHYATGKFVLDLHPTDIFWCTADPGWVTGTSYGIFAPLIHGVTNIVDEADFDAERWYRILEAQKVTVWYTAPTAIRRLMRLPIEPRTQYNLNHLRLVHSVGEPLNPEAVVWGEKALGLPIHDNWWQTETGGIMIANYPAAEIRPGSMGRPLPGIEAAIVRRKDDAVEVVTEPDVEGDLALKPGWPSMFRGYLHDEERYNKCFADGWYITGDLARRDADGYFWFVGRADDIIKTAGHMVGPFEVESALMEHSAVAEAGVIGKPDPVIGELVKAFVALKVGHEPSEALRMELLGFGRKKLGSAVAPKEIEFQASLPKTRSGKIMRRLLKARELGLPEGDISTLEKGK
jgi:acetyl-CoA synthetase